MAKYVKGQSGNPSKKFSKTNQPPKENVGRKRKLPELDHVMAEVLGDVVKSGKNAITIMQGIVMALADEALDGNTRAAEILLNRGYGMPKQKIDLTGVVETKSDKKAPVVKLPDGTILEL